MTYEEFKNSGDTILVEFFATWCPHCKRMAPIVDQVKELVAGRAVVRQFDIDENQEIADTENVTGVPTFILYHNGREVWRHSGEIDAQALLDKITGYIPKQ